MKATKLFALSIAAFTIIGTSACAGKKATISLWVGNETGTVEFYQKKANEFLAANPSFNFSITVKGTDAGSIAGTILKDPSACGDIYTVAHDNVGKLAQASSARPILDESLKTQIEADNSESFVNVSKSKIQDQEYLFAAPYISQALFLMYDARYVSDEQAKTFEGLREAAIAASTTVGKSVKAVECPGTDGFNFSFSLLARKESDKSTSFKLYADGTTANGQTNVQGDDEVAFAKWARDYRKDVNGFSFPTDAGWTLDIQNTNAISFIGGAWHYNSFASAVGETNARVALIPTFTLNAAQAFGTATEGTTYRGGTFADCKVFMINSKTDQKKFEAEQALIKFLTSKDVQNQAFKECSIVPAYKTFADNASSIEGVSESALALAKVQTGMSEYGIPQPFATAKLNNYYYQMGGPAAYQAIIDNADNAYSTDRKVQEGLYTLQYIWQNGEKPTSIPETLPDINCRPAN